jgi:hypothetical protein
MTQTLTKSNSDFPSLFRIINADGESNLPLPFSREIFLFDCHVAGTTYRAAGWRKSPKRSKQARHCAFSASRKTNLTNSPLQFTLLKFSRWLRLESQKRGSRPPSRRRRIYLSQTRRQRME